MGSGEGYSKKEAEQNAAKEALVKLVGKLMSKNYYIIPLFVPQEGCPHKCVFCNQDRITGSKESVTAQTV